jgi:hypothetical protein
VPEPLTIPCRATDPSSETTLLVLPLDILVLPVKNPCFIECQLHSHTTVETRSRLRASLVVPFSLELVRLVIETKQWTANGLAELCYNEILPSLTDLRQYIQGQIKAYCPSLTEVTVFSPEDI